MKILVLIVQKKNTYVRVNNIKGYYQALFKTEKNTSFLKHYVITIWRVWNGYVPIIVVIVPTESGNITIIILCFQACVNMFLISKRDLLNNNLVHVQRNRFLYTQLAYVLPKRQLKLLPEKIHKFLLDHYSELYCDEYEFQWAFCRYFWESHPILPKMELDMLEKCIYNFVCTWNNCLK